MYIVSGCLVGIPCKYNGGTNTVSALKDYLKGKSYVAVCPETMGGLEAPRPPAELQQGRVKNPFGEDLTEAFQRGAEKAYERARKKAEEAGEELTLAILKARSPSCGSGKVYDGTFSRVTVDGDGLFAALLKEKGIPVMTEEEFIEQFVEAEKVIK
ncbi:DUF523 domain-containing protein [Bacilliculturomica massiliensis]|uniref:DUF523 domain-containing protein n=1 Tax=Bacilliculturomica massiliensis TaxID=1917867 RepID=UPI00103140D1|nr:DUF523 domain-containing protein [Bacilliculturomica massiliensis]